MPSSKHESFQAFVFQLWASNFLINKNIMTNQSKEKQDLYTVSRIIYRALRYFGWVRIGLGRLSPSHLSALPVADVADFWH